MDVIDFLMTIPGLKMIGMIARFYKIFTWLSLDVTVGAIVFMCFLSREFATPVHPKEAIALGISVWLIYTIDHLLDVRTASSLVSDRRKFHHRYFNFLLVACGVFISGGIFIVSLLSERLLIYGIIMAVIASGYLIFARLRGWSAFKEIQIAIGYALGVSLVPLSHLDQMTSWHWQVLGMLFLTAFFNLILFSWFDTEQDRKEGFESLATYLGERAIRVLLWFLMGLSISGILALIVCGAPHALIIFFLVSSTVNLLIWRLANFFGRQDLYRFIGDGVFLLPIIWLI